MNGIPDDTPARETPVAHVRRAAESLADVCAALSPESGLLGDNERFSVTREIEFIARRAEVAAVLHAGHFAAADAALNRSRTRTAAGLSEATGCSRPQAHTRLDTFDLINTIAGTAFIELPITAVQARAIASAREPYEDLLDRAVLDKTEERIVQRAGTKSAATLKKEVQTSLSPKLPSDGTDRQAQQRAARAARLYGQQTDGMSKLVLTVTPGTRSFLGGLSAQASALRAKHAEEAAKEGRVPEDVSHEQAFHDLLVAHLAATDSAPPAQSDQRSSTVDDASSSSGTAKDEHPADSGAPSSTLAAPYASPVASIVIRLTPGDWTNLGTLVSTNSGAVVSVRDALHMASAGPSYLSTRISGRERLFRIDEIDPDSWNARSRFADALQRLVLYAQADGCRFPGCDEPAVRCQVHHLKPWNDGGRTTLANLLLVCRAHHNRINGSPDGWSVRRDPDDPEKFLWTPNTPAQGSAEPA